MSRAFLRIRGKSEKEWLLSRTRSYNIIFLQKMLSRGFSLPAPTYTYAWGESRAARMLAYSSELSGTPFSGVIQEREGGDIVESANHRRLRSIQSFAHDIEFRMLIPHRGSYVVVSHGSTAWEPALLALHSGRRNVGILATATALTLTCRPSF